ncbi:HutD/Ves family protein [Dyella agri]|uniref:HutD family protein n=1 Tax=Dyella agri TaxID=1926869 RepID=A0ABW8KJP4_9GAMM
MSILRLADCPARPWKNGLGRTRELAVHPPGAGMDDFLWRVSVAEVESAAPFSAFPGIDRVIALLDGEGFTMTLDDGRVHALTVPCAPFAFPGEAGVDVALAGGLSRDFNLMLRRGRARGHIEVWRTAGTRQADAAIVLVYCVHGRIDGADGSLQAGDAWRPSAGGALVLHADALALAVRVETVA